MSVCQQITLTSFLFITTFIIRETLWVCLFCMQLLYRCSTRKEKKKIWPVHCGQKKKKRGVGGELEKSREGFEPCKKNLCRNRDYKKTVRGGREGCSARWIEIGLREAEMIQSMWRTGRQGSTTESRGNMRTRGPAGDLNNQQFSHWCSGTLHNSSVIQRMTVCVHVCPALFY